MGYASDDPLDLESHHVAVSPGQRLSCLVFLNRLPPTRAHGMPRCLDFLVKLCGYLRNPGLNVLCEVVSVGKFITT